MDDELTHPPSDGDRPASRQARPGTWGWLGSHPGLAVSATLAILSAFQVMILASWNQETAQAIVQEQGSVQILTGTLLSTVSSFTPVTLTAGVLLPILKRWGFRVPVHTLVVWEIAVVSAGAILFFLPLATILLFALMGSLGLVLFRIARHQRSRKNSGTGLSSREPNHPALLVLLALMVTFTFMSQDPWMPTENIVLTDDRVTAGYVLSSTSDELVYLEVSWPTALVRRVPSSDVRARAVCVRGGSPLLNKTLPQIVLDRGSYVSCSTDPG